MKQTVRTFLAIVYFFLLIASVVGAIAYLCFYIYKEQDKIKAFAKKYEKQFKELKKNKSVKEIKEQLNSAVKQIDTAVKTVEEPIKKLVKIKPVKTVNMKAVDKGLNSRQSRLLNYFKKNKTASMKDINGRFKSVTQRTLRRDLDKLQIDGYITQQGATRDSVYILMR